MRRSSLAVPIILGVGLVIGTPGSGDATELAVPRLAEEEEDLLVTMHLREGFTPEILGVLHSGVPILIRYTANLYARNAVLFIDRRVASVRVTHRASYDVVAKRYMVAREEMGEVIEVMEDIHDMISRMTSVDRVTLASLDDLSEGRLYYVRARAEVVSMDVAPPLSYLFRYWNFKTAWRRTAFFRKGN